mmetsp:Transcript_61532/g.156308  ORF Transcript_61532/g.156308 Transcript_61532/m.156308 type:complete len:215 (-) Transcript_61532:866-1510(-)
MGRRPPPPGCAGRSPRWNPAPWTSSRGSSGRCRPATWMPGGPCMPPWATSSGTGAATGRPRSTTRRLRSSRPAPPTSPSPCSTWASWRCISATSPARPCCCRRRSQPAEATRPRAALVCSTPSGMLNCSRARSRRRFASTPGPTASRCSTETWTSRSCSWRTSARLGPARATWRRHSSGCRRPRSSSRSAAPRRRVSPNWWRPRSAATWARHTT